MAEEKVIKSVQPEGTVDRVTMLSLNSDGSVDQTRPEFIGDKDAALAATEEQFRQAAVSAVDVDKAAAKVEDSGKPDPSIEEAAKAHEAAVKAAESEAAKVVSELHKG